MSFEYSKSWKLQYGFEFEIQTMKSYEFEWLTHIESSNITTCFKKVFKLI